MIRRNLLNVLFFGSLWGLSEVFLGEYLYSNNIQFTSVYLSIIALGILAIAYKLMPKFGIPTLIAAIAAIYRVVNAGPFFCHLLAIFLLGVGFDTALYLLKKMNLELLHGALSSYLGFALFAFTITYIFRYHYWIAYGLPKVLKYIGIEGSLTALGSTLTVILGYMLGKNLNRLFNSNPKLVYAGSIGFTLTFWILGGVV